MRLSLSRVFLLCALSALPASAVDFDRELVLAPQAGSAPEDRAIMEAQARAQRAGASAREWERLGWAYVAKARRTQDAGCYKLAEKTVAVMDTAFGPSAGSRLLRGHVLHNLHRFAEAEVIARALVDEGGGPAELALLSDALMEQGKLAAAIAAVERLAMTKPGPECDARIAHLRWLRGDLSGAIAAMESALRATGARDAEARAWMLVRLSGFRLQQGEQVAASGLADAALELTPDYPPAQFARGRALVAEAKWSEAAVALRAVVRATRLPEAQWWLADVLREAGDVAGAERVEADLRRFGAGEDPRTLALFLATRDEAPVRAMRLASDELAQRADIFSHDAVAWARWRNGDAPAAAEAMRAARREGTRDARLALHAAIIARESGDAVRAAELFAEAQAARWTLTPSERALLEPGVAAAR